jgi:predicted RNA-binding protein with PUA-like domain
MEIGDLAFFYHSISEKSIVGKVEVLKNITLIPQIYQGFLEW